MNSKLLLSVLFATSFSANAADLQVKFADDAWNGMTIPTGQQCQKFGGQGPATPPLTIAGIPSGTTSLLLEYSDRDSKKMNNGGHGRMTYALTENKSMVTLPTVPGHSFELPKNFTMVEAHRGAGWDIDGAYMPPCSGGKGHAYYVTIQAMKGDKMTAKTVFELGKF